MKCYTSEQNHYSNNLDSLYMPIHLYLIIKQISFVFSFLLIREGDQGYKFENLSRSDNL